MYKKLKRQKNKKPGHPTWLFKQNLDLTKHLIAVNIEIVLRRQGRIRTAVKGFADPYLTTRPHDYFLLVTVIDTNINKVYKFTRLYLK